MNPKVFSSSAKFKTGEVLNILREVKSKPSDASHEVQVFNLVGVQAYVYSYSDPDKKSDCKSDNYRFESFQISLKYKPFGQKNHETFCE